MMRLIARIAVSALLVLLLCLQGTNAFALTYYVSDCGVGSSGTCGAHPAGSDAVNATQAQSQSTPIKTCAGVKSILFATTTTIGAGSQILFARGGGYDACNLSNIINTNSVKSNPIIFGSYDPGSETQAPQLNHAPGASFTLQLEDSGNTDHDEGYIVQDLKFWGGWNASATAIKLRGDVDYVTIRRVEISGYSGGIQCDGGATSAANSGSDGLTEHIIIRDSNLHDNTGNTILFACSYSLIEGNMMDGNGTGTLDHHIYIDDADFGGVAFKLKQIYVRGNTLTHNTPWKTATVTVTNANPGVVTWTAHGFSANQPLFIQTTGALPTNLPAQTMVYVVGSSITTNTFQVSLTAGGAAIDTTLGTQSGTHTGRARVDGSCASTAIIVHGDKDGIFIEDNDLSEPQVPTATQCWGISGDSGNYSGIYTAEGLSHFYIRRNKLRNFWMSAGVDICQHCEISDNVVVTEYAASSSPDGLRCIRSKYYEFSAESDDLPSLDITCRNNTVYIKNPGANTVGIRLDRHASDSMTGGLHTIVSNAVHFGPGGTTNTACFTSASMLATYFTAMDKNWCYSESTAAPAYMGTQTLAAWRAASGLDTNSTIGNNTPGSGNDTLIAPTAGNSYDATPGVGSPLIGVGHATLSSPISFGRHRRATPSIGAIERGLSAPVPRSGTDATVQ